MFLVNFFLCGHYFINLAWCHWQRSSQRMDWWQTKRLWISQDTTCSLVGSTVQLREEYLSMSKQLKSWHQQTLMTVSGNGKHSSLLIGCIYWSGTPALAQSRDEELHKILNWAADAEASKEKAGKNPTCDDLIFSKDQDSIQQLECTHPLGVGDHMGLSFVYEFQVEREFFQRKMYWQGWFSTNAQSS